MISCLAAGVDSIYWSARVRPSVELYAELQRTRESDTESRSGAVPWREVEGFSLSVLPTGTGKYGVALDCHEFRIQLTRSERLPGVYVQVRAAWLAEAGPRAAVAASRAVVESIVGQRAGEVHASRVDVYADFSDWLLVQSDIRSVVTNAKLSVHLRAGTDEIETLMVGKSPLAVRLYRKDIELRQRGGFADLLWGGWRGAVTRVEVEGASKFLRRLGVDSVDEALASYGDVWRHATASFMEMRVPMPGPRESWPLREEWTAVRAAGGSRFPSCGLVPYSVVAGRRDKVVPALLGYLASYGAFEDIKEPRACVRRLLSEFPDLVIPGRGRTFGGEVERRRAALPRTFRRLAHGLLPAGKDDDDRRTDLYSDEKAQAVGGHA